MYEELMQWGDFVVPRSQEFYAAVNEELVRLGKKPIEFEPQEEAGQAEAQPDATPEAPAQKYIPVSDGDDDDDAPKTIGTAYNKAMGRLGLDLSLGRDAIRSAAEFLKNDGSFSSGDIVAVCILAAIAVLQHPALEGERDPFLYSGNFCLSPKEVFGRSGNGDLRFMCMVCELDYDPLHTDSSKAIDEVVATVEKHNWFSLLKDLQAWQAQQAEGRRTDPRQYDLVEKFNCL
jgi:hypothetical protein